jgi:hypothetical protein
MSEGFVLFVFLVAPSTVIIGMIVVPILTPVVPFLFDIYKKIKDYKCHSHS